MREMKDSGIEWIGNIPATWERCKIKNVISSIGSGTTPTSSNIDYYNSEDICWIQSGDLYKTSYISNTAVSLSDKALHLSALQIYAAPFIVVAMYGASVGNIAISTIDACSNQACCCIKPDNNNDLKFMYYWLSMCKIDFLSQSIGGGQPNISQSKIRNQFYYRPQLSEQKVIANFLDSKCSEIDAISADIQKEIEILEQYKRSVITEAVTKGLNPDVEMKDSGVRHIGKIPADWKSVKIKYLAKERSENGLFNPEKDHYIGLENVASYSNSLIKTETEYTESLQNKVYCGDVMFSRLRPYLAKVIIAPFDCFSTGEFLQLYGYIGDKRYLRYNMLSVDFIKEVNMSTYGAKMPRANSEFIINLKIPQPPVAEQKQIADFLDSKCKDIESAIADKKRQFEVLDSYKKSLIYEYVTEKKEVPNYG